MASNPTLGEIPSHWEFTTLGKICERGGGNIQTGPFGSQLHASDYVSEGVPTIMPVNIGENRLIEDGIMRITEADANRLSKHRVRAGDIIYSRRGDVERRALVRKAEDGWFCGTGCLKVRLGKGVVDPQYASFYLGHPAVRSWIVQHAVGATMPNLNTAIMEAIPFALPPLSEQKRIAHILGTLDDKIELNRRMNATLEAMARALFQSWFVDFDPVRAKAAGQTPAGMDQATADLFPSEVEDSELGEIPKGWTKRRAEEFVRVTIGKTPPRKEPQWFSESEVDVPWVSIRDLGTSGTFVSQTSERLTQKGIDRFNVRVVPRDTVILSFKLTVGRVAITDVELATNEAIAHFGIDPASGVTTEFLYLALLAFDFDSLGSTSSIATAVNSDSVRSIEICIPPAALIEAFTAIVKPLFAMIRSTQAGTRTLAETRDALLPRLLSGDLDSSGVGE